jgi:outer membrane protein OmpA-like peptidoglycan-associated protein
MGSSVVKVASSDGTGIITVATSSATVLQTEFSPDGTKLYFDNNQGTDLFSVDATVANTTQAGTSVLTATQLEDWAISSTGKIAYVDREASCGSYARGLFVRVLTGTGSGTFVPGSCTSNNDVTVSPTGVAWSSDGAKLYLAQTEFDSNTSQRSKPVINEFTETGKVGSTFFEHSTTEKYIYDLSMSPDGTKLAFNISDSNSYVESISLLNLSTKVATGIWTPANSSTYLRRIFWAPQSTVTSAVTTTTTTPVRTTAPTTTTAVTTTTPSSTTSTPLVSNYSSAIPGITVTDPTVYRTAPKEVAGKSAIIVLTPLQNKVLDIVSKTPSVCLPNDDNLVFIDEGKCIAEVVNAKTRKALRTLRTTVVKDDISELKVGNEVAVLAPLYFVAGSFDFKRESLARLAKLKNRITNAGSVLVAGHSGILLGNTPENIKLAGERAKAAVKELKARGAKGPFSVASVGALDPATTLKTQAAQDKNRRVVIVLIP